MRGDENRLQLDQDLAFQRANWRFERIGWGVMAVLVLAALLGLFGKGPLSDATARTDNAALNYQRFSHWESPDRLTFHIRAPGEQTVLRLSRAYLERVRVEEITPAPVSTRALSEWIEFKFHTGGESTITFHIQPQTFGLQRAQYVVDNGARVAFWQFVYP